MNRKIGSVVLAAALTASVAATAGAQARGYLGLGAGISIATGDFKDEGAKTGWMAQVIGGITAPSGVLGGRISGTFARHGSSVDPDDHKRELGAMADLVVSPKMSGKAGVYLLAGAGFQNLKATGGEGKTKFAWNAGAGVNIKAGAVGIYVESRFLSVSAFDTGGSKVNTIPITVGVRLGGK